MFISAPWVGKSRNYFFKYQTFPPKNERTNSTLLLYYYETSGRLVFVRFLEEIEDTKKTFRNYLTFRICLLRFCHLFCSKAQSPMGLPKISYFRRPCFQSYAAHEGQTVVSDWQTGRAYSTATQIQGNEDVQAQCAVYGLHTPESTW